MANKKITRREALKTFGLSLGALSLTSTPLEMFAMSDDEPLDLSVSPEYADKFAEETLDKPVTAIVLGAGARGRYAYGSYAVKYPQNMDIIGVAEPIAVRNEQFAKEHNIDTKYRFDTWEDVFKKPKFADAVIITTPDALHYAPCMKALKMGYDVLIEKPIAPTEQECRDILAQSKKYGGIVAVCHVLRYTNYYKALKDAVASGQIGRMLSIQHFEPIEVTHFSHSFVRGNWRNSVESTPLILSKSCHDLDILRWLVDKPCKKVVAFGDLSYFNANNAPEGSPARCTDGCKAEPNCHYSAIDTYYRRRVPYLHHFDFVEGEDKGESIMRQIKINPYGRCVYKCDNDQPDHYVMSMEFDDNITVNFSMEACTSYGGRRIRIMGTEGDIVGDDNTFTITRFDDRKQRKPDIQAASSGHGGGDWGITHDFALAVSKKDPSLLISTIDASMDSHLMAFAAERSRESSNVEKV